MQINEAALDQLNRYTVAIQKTGSDGVLGTGVIVTNDGLIVTCYHVVGNIKTKTLDEVVGIYFPSAHEIKGHANVLEEYSDSSLDIAFLQLQEKKLPKQAAVANLSETIDSTHTFRSFGFRKEKTFGGLYTDGTIQGKVRKKFRRDNDNDLLQEVIQLKSDGIDHGMSGAAVLDTQINRVIGIVSEYLATSGNVDKNLALAIPIDVIIQVCPGLKQKNPGLKILEFSRKIGSERVKKYERIDELYVPPTNYHNIKESLYKDRILFLTGTQEYGKTYTAVHLLWEYFNKGYEPVWFKGAEENEEERRDVRRRFLNIEKYLKPGNIIYFEDPFGKTEYEVNVDEGIVRNIASIIETIENVEDIYVIITSREEVFKQFEHNITAEIDLRKYEIKMILKTQSYNYEKRKEMLLKWGKIMNCKWLADEDLKNIVFEILGNEGKLPTPLNIEQFALATVNVLEKSKLIDKINAKSKETVKSFANEIKLMSEDKIVFLSFPFISEYFTVDFIKENYLKFIKELNIEEEQDTGKFDRIVDWFKDDKIDINYNEYSKNKVIRFSHPSYFEAIRIAICENGSLTKAGKILSNILLKLSHSKDAADSVAKTVGSNLDKLPENVRNELLLKLAESKETAYDAAKAVASNFDKLPEDVRNILFKLAENTEADGYEHVVSAIVDNFDKLPENVRNILFKLAENKDWGQYIVVIIVYNYNRLPEDARNILFKLAENEETAGCVAYRLIKNFKQLPYNVRTELLRKLAEFDDKEVARDVVAAIVNNFDYLPEDVRNILFKLADNKETSLLLAKSLANKFNFRKLPNNIRNELLLKLADNKEAAKDVVHVVIENYNMLPENVHSILFRSADNKETAKIVANNIDNLHKNLRNKLLRRLSMKENSI
jgi:hypothetical protein